MDKLQKTERYYSRIREVPKEVYNSIGGNDIIYGKRASNKQLPPYLHTQTTDYDVFSKRPLAESHNLERKLDRFMGYDAFETVPAQHKGTWRVKSKQDGEVYADFTKKPDERIPVRVIQGKKFVDLEWIRRKAKKTLQDPTSRYRHHQDRDTLSRIELYKKRRGVK